MAVYFLIGAVFLFWTGGWKIVLLAGFSGIVARYLVCELIIRFYKKPHPYQSLNFNVPTSWLFSRQDKRSDAFPSQHTTTAAAIAVVFWLFSPVWGAVAMAAAIIIGIARIILGYHDIWDVVGGLFIGMLSGIVLVYCLFLVFSR